MSDNFESSLINLGELSKPATVLVEKISDAVGGIYKNDAELFTKLCGFAWLIGNLVPLIYDEQQEIYNRLGINFNTLSHLESIGLIQFQSLGFRRLKLPKTFAVLYYGIPVLLTMPNEIDNELKLGKVMLTKTGHELAPICGSKPVEDFFDYVHERWNSEGYISQSVPADLTSEPAPDEASPEKPH